MRRLIDADSLLEVSNYEFYQDASAITPIGEHILFKFRNLIRNFPSAQPEIVRCEDCKHYGYILYSGTQFEYGECFGHEESDYTFEVKPDDFCSRAERRTDD